LGGTGCRFNNPSAQPSLSPIPGDNAGYLGEHRIEPDLASKHSLSPPTAIPVRDYLHANLNFLEESSSSPLSLDSYSSERLASYSWKVSIANPLLGPFASVGMPPIDTVEEPDQDPLLSSSLASFDLEDGPCTHYIDPSFYDKLKRIVYFKVIFSFK